MGSFIAKGSGIRLHSEEDALNLIGTGARGAVLTPDELHPDFFDLRNGVAGAIFQKLINYNFKTAIIVPADHAYGERVAELVRDHSKHDCVRFFATTDEAAAWLGNVTQKGR